MSFVASLCVSFSFFAVPCLLLPRCVSICLLPTDLFWIIILYSRLRSILFCVLIVRSGISALCFRCSARELRAGVAALCLKRTDLEPRCMRRGLLNLDYRDRWSASQALDSALFVIRTRKKSTNEVASATTSPRHTATSSQSRQHDVAEGTSEAALSSQMGRMGATGADSQKVAANHG